jgi:hypothetical protein
MPYSASTRLILALLDRHDPRWRDHRRRIPPPFLLALALVVLAFHGAGQSERQEIRLVCA